MKKILNDNSFEGYFEPSILSRGERYYRENRIMDIWCQGDTVTAYIDGSEIYKVELTMEDNEILYGYCTCPYSADGEFMCKHMAATLYYLNENEVPELETMKPKIKESFKTEAELSKIYDMMKHELRQISDGYGFVNYYNGRKFVRLIDRVANYIDNFIDTKNYDDAFELIKYSYFFISKVFMDGSNGEYQETLYTISDVASKLLYNEDFFEIFSKWACEIYNAKSLEDFSDAPLYSLILFASDKITATKVINILDKLEFDYGIFVSVLVDKIELTYNFIDKKTAIKMCYDNIDNYHIKELLLKYLKKEKNIPEVIKILKDNIENNIGKYNAYNELLKVYEENNMLNERKELLIEVIIETSDLNRFKELKKMCSKKEWHQVKEEIITNIEPNNNLLKDIYMEEKETDKLFDLLKQTSELFTLSKYQEGVKDKYSKELLKLYKPLIIENSKYVSDRNSYYGLCRYIKKMGELNNSEDFIFDVLDEMYPNYQNRPAFKEEIMEVLENKDKFKKLLESKKAK